MLLRNEEVLAILAGVPRGHKHVRFVLETSSGRIVLQEATVAALVRAYVSIKTHPARRAIELRQRKGKWKEGYAEFQLLETNRDETVISEVLLEILKEESYGSASK